MGYVQMEQRRVYLGSGGPSAPVIYFVDEVEHPFDLSQLPAGLDVNVVAVLVERWGDSLTPWPAEGLYRGEPAFGGHAATTLTELWTRLSPLSNRRRDSHRPSVPSAATPLAASSRSMRSLMRTPSLPVAASRAQSGMRAWSSTCARLTLSWRDASRTSPWAPKNAERLVPSFAPWPTTWRPVRRYCGSAAAAFVLTWCPATTCRTSRVASQRAWPCSTPFYVEGNRRRHAGIAV